MSTAEIESLSLSGLAERLAEVRNTRTALGWATDQAVTKSSLERRILEVVCTPRASDTSSVLCDHEVSLQSKRRTIESDLAEVRSGGVVLPNSTGLNDGEEAVLNIRTENNYPLKVKCVVRELNGVNGGVAVAFENLDPGAERRVQRLILELLKSQAE